MSNDNDMIDWNSEEFLDNASSEGIVATPGSVPAPPVFSSTSVDIDPVEVTDMESFTAQNDGFTPQNIVSVTGTADFEGEDHLAIVQQDAEGNEVRTVIDFASPPLSEEEARDITETIRSTTNVLYILIKRAHAGKAWEALGYSSFQAYVREEFSMSRSYAYKLLNQATVIEAIQAAAPEGTEVYVTEHASRSLKNALPELVAEIEERTEGLDPESATQIVQEAIEAEQQRKHDENNFDSDYDTYDPKAFANPSEGFDFADDDDDDEDFEPSIMDGNPNQVVQKLERLYNLLTTLRTMGEYAEQYNIDELIEIIPPDREEDITYLLKRNSEWLKELQTSWDSHLESKPVSDNEEEINFNNSSDDDEASYF